MSQADITLRTAKVADLEQLNRVIDAAIMTWDLPDRVKRLSRFSFHYTSVDLQHFEIIVAKSQDKIAGVVAWDRQAQAVTGRQHGLLMHGLYVDPAMQHRGIGTRLFRCAERAVIEAHQDGLWVKAQKDAEAFYQACGMHKLPARDHGRGYAHRYWKSLQPPS